MRANLLLNTNYRLSDNLRVICQSEGIPFERGYELLKYRHQSELEHQRYLAITLFNLIRIQAEGGTFMDMAEHLYPKGFGEKMEEKRREAEELNKSEALLQRFRALAQREDLEDYNA